MKKIIIVAFFLVSKISFGQIVYIPDSNFKNALVSTICADTNGDGNLDGDVDINNDGEIQVSEAEKVTLLNLRNKNIDSLNGINSFKNIISLNCTQNKITKIEISNFASMKELICPYNFITDLKIPNSSKIEKIDIISNNLNSLDLSNLIFLREVLCLYNPIKVLNVENLPEVESMLFGGNIISQVNLSNLPKLKSVDLSGNNLTQLNIKNLPSLVDLNCPSNKLTQIALSNLPALKYLSCYDNPLLSLFIKIESSNNSLTNFGVFAPLTLKYICTDENKFSYFKNKYPLAEVNSYCTFTPGGEFYSIIGKSKFDEDNNGCDSNDINVPNLKYAITNGSISGNLLANASGIYSISVQEGIHTITPSIENSQFFNISPPSIIVTFPTSSDTIIQNFCINPKQVLRQVDITILPLSPPARPGFNAQYKVVITNKGNQRESGKLNFRYDETLLNYVNADVNPSTQSDGLVAWDYKDFLPFETRTYTVTLKVNKPTDTPAVNTGDELQIVASILDNVFILKNTVVGSFDPNDKTCLEGDKVTPDMIGKYVHYLIRFENTGTYAAENVVVKDIIDEVVFDLTSLQITDASHRAFTKITGNVVEFIFEDIQLPFDDATNDGFIAFKIKTKPTLKLGDELKNKANIYFDYNFPIVTNEAKSVISMVSATHNIESAYNVELYPNPAGDYINITTTEDVIKVEIYDVAGRILQSTVFVNNQVDVKSLTTGIYLFKCYTKDGLLTSKKVRVGN